MSAPDPRTTVLIDFGGVLTTSVHDAQDLATQCSPASLATIKAQVQNDLDRPFAEAVADADRLMLESFARPDVQEGVASYLEQRPPAFPALTTRS